MSELPSYALKLERAFDHLNELDRQVNQWIREEPYQVISEPDPGPPPQSLPAGHLHYRFRIEAAKPIPSSWGLLIGDCLFNTRSALDHLAMSLARAHTRQMTEKQVERSEFPIFRMPPEDTRTEHNKIGCINPDARKVILGFQPYKECESFESSHLWRLHELNRIDKHRKLTICTVESREGNVRGFEPIPVASTVRDFRIYTVPRIELVLDAVIGRWSGIPTAENGQMKVISRLSLQVVFDSECLTFNRRAVVPMLSSILGYIRDVVVPPLAPYLRG